MALANKLWDLGDAAGYERELGLLKAADPEGMSEPLRRTILGSLQEDVYGCRQTTGVFDPAPIEEFLEVEQHSAIRYEGWSYLARIHDQLGNRAEARRDHARALDEVPESLRAQYSVEVAWVWWSHRAELEKADKRFALARAREALELVEALDPAEVPDLDTARARVLDTLACCYYMNGKAREGTRDRARGDRARPRAGRVRGAPGTLQDPRLSPLSTQGARPANQSSERV